MNKIFETLKNKLISELKVIPYMDIILLQLVQQGYWSEITIDYCPSKTVINLNRIPHAIVYHGRILENDLFAYGVDLNTIKYVKPEIEYLNLVKEIKG